MILYKSLAISQQIRFQSQSISELVVIVLFTTTRVFVYVFHNVDHVVFVYIFFIVVVVKLAGHLGRHLVRLAAVADDELDVHVDEDQGWRIVANLSKSSIEAIEILLEEVQALMRLVLSLSADSRSDKLHFRWRCHSFNARAEGWHITFIRLFCQSKRTITVIPTALQANRICDNEECKQAYQQSRSQCFNALDPPAPAAPRIEEAVWLQDVAVVVLGEVAFRLAHALVVVVEHVHVVADLPVLAEAGGLAGQKNHSNHSGHSQFDHQHGDVFYSHKMWRYTLVNDTRFPVWAREVEVFWCAHCQRSETELKDARFFIQPHKFSNRCSSSPLTLFRMLDAFLATTKVTPWKMDMCF